jgi:hypothetical protein
MERPVDERRGDRDRDHRGEQEIAAALPEPLSANSRGQGQLFPNYP